jgi:hemoglobin
MKRIATLALASVLAVSSPAFADDSLYKGLGGKEGINKIVSTLIPLVLADPRIKDTFDGVDLKNLAKRLEEQFCELSGGPCKYGGKDMVTIHDGMNVTNMQFNALAEDLQIAMERNNIPSSVSNKLMAKLAPMQRQIVTK